jgi:hypothetical protein
MAPGTQPFKVQSPTGNESEVPAGGTYTATDSPGVYRVTPGDDRFVVNLSPDESRLQPLDASRLTTLGVPLLGPSAAVPSEVVVNRAAIQAAEVESRQKLWRWLLLAAVGVLLLETFIAARLSQLPRQSVPS